ncbi:hypothetical protein BGZ94_006695, partial [Podila epigama]
MSESLAGEGKKASVDQVAPLREEPRMDDGSEKTDQETKEEVDEKEESRDFEKQQREQDNQKVGQDIGDSAVTTRSGVGRSQEQEHESREQQQDLQK